MNKDTRHLLMYQTQTLTDAVSVAFADAMPDRDHAKQRAQVAVKQWRRGQRAYRLGFRIWFDWGGVADVNAWRKQPHAITTGTQAHYDERIRWYLWRCDCVLSGDATHKSANLLCQCDIPMLDAEFIKQLATVQDKQRQASVTRLTHDAYWQAYANLMPVFEALPIRLQDKHLYTMQTLAQPLQPLQERINPHDTQRNRQRHLIDFL